MLKMLYKETLNELKNKKTLNIKIITINVMSTLVKKYLSKPINHKQKCKLKFEIHDIVHLSCKLFLIIANIKKGLTKLSEFCKQN